MKCTPTHVGQPQNACSDRQVNREPTRKHGLFALDPHRSRKESPCKCNVSGHLSDLGLCSDCSYSRSLQVHKQLPQTIGPGWEEVIREARPAFTARWESRLPEISAEPAITPPAGPTNSATSGFLAVTTAPFHGRLEPTMDLQTTFGSSLLPPINGLGWVKEERSSAMSFVCGQPGVYGATGTPAPGNFPGARSNAANWNDSNGNFWPLWGEGFDSSGETLEGVSLNDLWEYFPVKKTSGPGWPEATPHLARTSP
jgi:hypothetical protein